MKLLLSLFLASVGAFVPQQTAFSRSSTSVVLSSAVESTGPAPTTKAARRKEIIKEENFHRMGFRSERAEAEELVSGKYQSEVVKDMKGNKGVLQKEGVTAHLATDYGFCWGVERSISLAYEALSFYDKQDKESGSTKERNYYLTNELIHNPEVNEGLQSAGIKFIEKDEDGNKDFSPVGDNDVVMLPAFGATIEEMEKFTEQGVQIVDTTCPWVSKVWNTVEKHQKNDLTSVIHGKYGHEETIATVSFCEDYICVKDMAEAEYVANYIINGGDKEEFMKKFAKATSKGFDPDTMLEKIGLANQTTMYKKETRAIGQLFQKTIMKKFGPAEVDQRYMEFDTICDATQERQDAISYLTENAEELNLDFILVIGGWDSSNTAHLLEIPRHAGIRSFHINRAECIKADNTITHREMDGSIVTEKFLLENFDDSGKNQVIMGVTSGASTPDKAVEESLSQIFLLNSVLKKEE